MQRCFYIKTYGCQMNANDSEKISGLLSSNGYIETLDIKKADIIIFNTCSVRKSAENRALGNIGTIKNLKEKNKNLIIVVCGCLSQNKENFDLLKNNYNHIDIILGSQNIEKLLYYLDNYDYSTKIFDTNLDESIYFNNEIKKKYKNDISALVKIMTGCNNYCSYCIVPYVRGREVSRDVDSILEECNQLLDKGYKEITLIGQNVNSYLYKDITFLDLLKKITNLKGKKRIKFMTSHPKDLSIDLIDLISTNESLLKYIHLPLQSGSNRILELMNRKYTREKYMDLINYIKKNNIIGLSTDIMVGFPSETEKDFNDTLELVEKTKFNNIFTFIYSIREGTEAAKMKNQIDLKTKKRRIKNLIELQYNISKSESKKLINKNFEVLAYFFDKEKILCKTNCDKIVYVYDKNKVPGNFFNVKIKEIKNSNLIGEII